MTQTLQEQFSKQTEPDDESPKKLSFWHRCFRVIYDSIRGFIEDDCYAKASALTFYSLLSIVPVLAVLFGIAQGFGFERTLEAEIVEKFSDQYELTQKLIQFAYSWLQSVKGGVIAGFGTVLLLWSVIGLLNNVEAALNAIWKTRIARPYTRKISDYLATLVIAPLFFVTSSSITVFLTTQITQHAKKSLFIELVGPAVLFLLQLFPFFLTWTLFTFLYLFMPNTKVYFRTAAIAGIMAGTAFQLWQWAYIKFQIGVASYGAIYGSFAALPLFLIWLQISWMIVLGGAEFAVELENDLFIPNRILQPISTKAAALFITYRCIEAFAQSRPPLTDKSISQELGMSLIHVHIILEVLQKARILSKATFTDKTYGYQPARSIQSITMKTVCDAIDKSNELPASIQNSEEMHRIQEYLSRVDCLLEEKQNNELLYQSESSKSPKQLELGLDNLNK